MVQNLYAIYNDEADTKESSLAGDKYYIENTKESIYKLE